MRVFAGVCLLFVLLALPSAAIAGGNPSAGVHVDPGSPAGKQYGFPVNSARGETSGAGKSGSAASSGGASASPPLFGAGVTAPGTHASTTGTPTSPTTTTHAGSTQTKPSKPVSASLASHVVPSNAGSDAWIPLVAGGLLVLALGTGAGLALKRRL